MLESFFTTRVRKFDFLGVLFQCRLESNLKKKIPREIIQNAFSSIQDKTLNDRKLQTKKSWMGPTNKVDTQPSMYCSKYPFYHRSIH